jgi:hypothetical protein
MNHGRGGVRRYINRKIDPATTARLAFQLFDLRKEGKVFRDDLARAMEQLQLRTFRDAKQLTALFDRMDTERKGWVSEEEAIAFLEANPGALSDPSKSALLERFKRTLLPAPSAAPRTDDDAAAAPAAGRGSSSAYGGDVAAMAAMA